MRNWFQNLMYKLNQWMYGRYGNDELGNVLVIAAFVMLFLAYIPYLYFFMFLSFFTICYSIFRSFSKNIAKRRKELEAYLKLKKKVTGKFSLYKRMWKDRKTTCYFKCKRCGTVLRVPKNKGKLEITCPKCQDKQIKRT